MRTDHLTKDEVLAVRASAVDRLAGLSSPWAAVDVATAVSTAQATAETIKLCDDWLARYGQRASHIGFI